LVLRWDAVDALFPPGLLDAMFAAYLERVRALADAPGLWDSPRPELLPPDQRALQDAAHASTRPHAAATLVDLFLARLATQPAAPAV
ncbi:hypothetical protein, partial [Klebsiella pneumoniae]|uniref:hypothetical protein n=1 Tax=Klebsiella pneumoniae TaxID=573 RepID=UPI0025A0E57C